MSGKGMALILTLILISASLVILYQFNISSMASASQGVNLSSSPIEMQEAYQASTHVTIAAISVSRYVILLLGIASVLLSLIVMIMMAKANQPKGM